MSVFSRDCPLADDLAERLMDAVRAEIERRGLSLEETATICGIGVADAKLYLGSRCGIDPAMRFADVFGIELDVTVKTGYNGHPEVVHDLKTPLSRPSALAERSLTISAA